MSTIRDRSAYHLNSVEEIGSIADRQVGAAGVSEGLFVVPAVRKVAVGYGCCYGTGFGLIDTDRAPGPPGSEGAGAFAMAPTGDTSYRRRRPMR